MERPIPIKWNLAEPLQSTNGRWVNFTVGSSGATEQITDNEGCIVSYQYDGQVRLNKVISADGAQHVYTHDANNPISTVSNGDGNFLVRNNYDVNGCVASQNFADGNSIIYSYTLDANQQNVIATRVTDRAGIQRRVSFAPGGYITPDIYGYGNPNAQTTNYSRDGNGLLLGVTDPMACAPLRRACTSQSPMDCSPRWRPAMPTPVIDANISYTPYGVMSRTGVNDGSSQMFSGREDDGTGFIYMRARYYAPSLARFLSRDPSGLNGGANTYAYGNGVPNMLSNPFGLDADTQAEQAVERIGGWYHEFLGGS